MTLKKLRKKRPHFGFIRFVSKPIRESELMAALQRHLDLDWVTAGAAANPASASPADDHRKLPDDARAELIRLIHLGHVHGLHRLLDQFATEDPLLVDTCDRLRSFVNRCELEALLDELTEEDDALEA